MEKFNCPKCGKELICLEPHINAMYDFWCDDCDVDIRIIDNKEKENSNRWYNFRTIDVTNEKQGRSILAAMRSMIHYYGCVSIADLYDMLGLESGHASHKYGWVTLNNAIVVNINNRFVLKFSKPIILD